MWTIPFDPAVEQQPDNGAHKVMCAHFRAPAHTCAHAHMQAQLFVDALIDMLDTVPPDTLARSVDVRACVHFVRARARLCMTEWTH